MPRWILWMLLIALVSCGSQDEKSSILNEGPPTEVTGVWTRPCMQSDATYDITELVVGNPSLLMDSKFYSDSGCKTLEYTALYRGSYALGDVYGEGKSVDLLPATLEFTPVSASYVSYFNFLKLCGHDDWKANETHACNDQAKALYTIYVLEQDSLMFGKTTPLKPGSTAQTRPTVIDRAEVYTRH